MTDKETLNEPGNSFRNWMDNLVLLCTQNEHNKTFVYGYRGRKNNGQQRNSNPNTEDGSVGK